MTTKIDTSVPVEHFSHWIETRRWKKVNEQIHLNFDTKWRGDPAFIQMVAERYTYADGNWSPWRIWCEYARAEKWGQHHSDTARTRFREAFTPVVQEWLNSNAYAESRKTAFKNHAVRVLHELDSSRDAERVREFIQENRHELDEELIILIDNACAAYEDYQEQLAKVESF